MYLLYARRNPQEEWSAWTQTGNIESIKRNIKTIEGFGWQWKVGQADDEG